MSFALRGAPCGDDSRRWATFRRYHEQEPAKRQGPFVGRFGELVDEAGHRDIADPSTLFAGGQPEPDQQQPALTTEECPPEWWDLSEAPDLR